MASKPPTAARPISVGQANTAQPKSYSIRAASTSSDVDNIYRYVDAKVDGLRSEMKGELATLAATVQAAEAQRSADYTKLAASVDAVKDNLPTKTTAWQMLGALFVGGIAVLAFLWTAFDTGVGVTGVFAEKVVEDIEQQNDIEAKIDKILESQVSDKPQGSAPKK